MPTNTKTCCPLRGSPVKANITGQPGYMDMDCIREKCGFWVDTSNVLMDFNQGCAVTVLAYCLSQGGL